MAMKYEYINIDQGKRAYKAEFYLTIFKEGNFTIVYIDSLDISSYGYTKKEALHMLVDVILPDYLGSLLKSKKDGIAGELEKYEFIRSKTSEINNYTWGKESFQFNFMECQMLKIQNH